MEQLIKRYNELEIPEDSRAKIIVMAVFLDELLAMLIKKTIVKSTAIKEKPLFEFNNLFGTFGNKITVAYIFGLISIDEYTVLKAIQSIRNKAAHSLTEKTFDLENPDLLNEFLAKTFPENILQSMQDKSDTSEFRKSTRDLVTADNINSIFEFSFHRSCLALLSRICNATELNAPEPRE